MRTKARVSSVLILAVAVLSLLAMSFLSYFSATPKQYTFAVGEISTEDILSPRSVMDRTATEEAARNAEAAVETVWVRSESISEDAVADLEYTLQALAEARVSMSGVDPETGLPPSVQSAASDVLLNLNRATGVEMDADAVVRLITIEDASFQNIRNNTVFLAESILADSMDKTRLELTIAQRSADIRENATQYREDLDLIPILLTAHLKPNTIVDQNATDNARQAAYDAVMANPITIERGTYIVQKGDLITSEIYERLADLHLLESSRFDMKLFSAILLHLLVITTIGWAYLRNHARDQMAYFGNRITMLLALAIPFLLSVYTIRLSPLAVPTYFTAVILCAYFGLRTSIMMSSLLTIALLPMSGYDVKMLLVSLTGCIAASLFAHAVSRRDNYAYLILVTAGVCLASVTGYSIFFQTGWDALVDDATYAILSSSLSVISAIGLMPVFEMMLNTVSPMRLIELSQTGNILLRRLFIEAPGTSQHSMMVANLADSAAEAIDANPLLARVGSYYHDIGKLDNPHMFIENQQGDNPHDQLPAAQSAALIIAHPEAGVKIGKKYRLPPALLKIIHEHHGSTMQSYFYHKARKEAEQSGSPEPDQESFRYPGPVPSSRESALVMLADSVEAAVRSADAPKIHEVENLIRRIIKNKNEQDQLVKSGLSFRDIEIVIHAFLQVYAGHFHERIAYPDDRPVRRPAAKIFR